jgi:hypothetical protein
MGHRLQQFLLPFGRIIDLGEFLLHAFSFLFAMQLTV